MAKLYIPEEGRSRGNGILVVYYEDAKTFWIEAWSDGNFAVAEGHISLAYFLRSLGITKEDCLEVFEKG